MPSRALKIFPTCSRLSVTLRPSCRSSSLTIPQVVQHERLEALALTRMGALRHWDIEADPHERSRCRESFVDAALDQTKRRDELGDPALVRDVSH
jgi:hypothetical protein